MTREQDIALWQSISENATFTHEDIAPLRVIAEAIDERCAAVGLPLDDSIHAKVTDWPSVELYEAIYQKIRDLLPHFISIDGLSSLYSPFISPTPNRYVENQYSNFPLTFQREYSRRVGSNCSRYPMEMTGNEDLKTLNTWYAACKWWLKQMKYVDVSEYAFLSNRWNGEVEFNYQRNGPYVWYYDAQVNGESVSGIYNVEQLFDALDGNSLSSDVSHDEITLNNNTWNTHFSYTVYKKIAEYWLSGETILGEERGDLAVYDCTNIPGLVRFQNPAPLSGDLHVVLRPSRRMQVVFFDPELVDYSTEPSEYPNFSEIEVHSDIQHREELLGYRTLNGTLFSQSVFGLKEATEYPGYDPMRYDVSSTTTTYYNDFWGHELTSSTTHEEYVSEPHYASIISKNYSFQIYDGGSYWPLGQHDKRVGSIGAYEILDEVIFDSVDRPQWWDPNEIPDEIPNERFFDYRREVVADVFCSQSAKAYIDYSPSFKYT